MCFSFIRKQICLHLLQGDKNYICRNSKLLILDEATSAIDVLTEQKMRSLIQSQFSNCTVITIAHRLNTVLSCDRSEQGIVWTGLRYSDIQSLCDGEREDH